MFGKVKSFGEKYGWGAVIAGTPYVNGLLVMTAGLACYLLYVVFSLFGIYPMPPSETLNPISWILYVLFQVVFGWFMWSYMTSGLLFLLGAAWSLADLIFAQATKNEARFRGAVAGLCLTVVPISLWYKSQPGTGPEHLMFRVFLVASHFVHHIR